jgi:hypothetical protein
MPTLRLLPELEDALRHLPGVKAASVVTGPDAVPTEVHVLAAPGKAPKQVVRDVQSLALTQYDIDIDHRIVSVVQISDDEVRAITPNGVEVHEDTEPAEPESHVVRPSLAAVMVRSGGGETSASVTLSIGEHHFEGHSQGPAGTSHRARLVALATLEAVSELLGQPCEVESCIIVPTGSREVALSVLTVMVPRTGEQVLTGAAVVRGDEADAVVRSVLAALNRQLAG